MYCGLKDGKDIKDEAKMVAVGTAKVGRRLKDIKDIKDGKDGTPTLSWCGTDKGRREKDVKDVKDEKDNAPNLVGWRTDDVWTNARLCCSEIKKTPDHHIRRNFPSKENHPLK